MKHERFKRKEKFSPLQFGVMQLAHGKADLEPSPEAPFRVVPPKEEMMALVLHGLHSTNAHLAKSSDPLIYSEGPYRRYIPVPHMSLRSPAPVVVVVVGLCDARTCHEGKGSVCQQL